MMITGQLPKMGSGQRRIYSLILKLLPGLTLHADTFYNRPKAGSTVGGSDTSWEISAIGPNGVSCEVTSRLPFYSFFRPGVTCVSASVSARLGFSKINLYPLDSRGIKEAITGPKYPYTECKIHFDSKGTRAVFISLSGDDRAFWIAATGVEKAGATSKTVGSYSMFRFRDERLKSAMNEKLK